MNDKVNDKRHGSLRIEGGSVLSGGGFVEASVDVTAEGLIAEAAPSAPSHRLDAEGLLVLPGIVDIHGDAFERQMMPRAGVHFPIDIALVDSDRQAVATASPRSFTA
jgi:alpha-D-ribose 1-methylphosphonate 5-triphosphate diphosphatase